jgi:uncharacterized coiled-coil DUF342 family protein
MTQTPGAAVTIEISPGELIDKITILEIKSERMTDAAKLINVRTELDLLAQVRVAALAASHDLDALASDLKQVNEALWEIEDAIRLKEKAQDFGAEFVALARSVYRINDERAALKRRINDLLGAVIVEEKSYEEY